MKRYHVNPKTGNPNICQAKIGFCPFGADEPHYLSKDEARKATENKYNEVYGFFGSPVDEILEMESIVEIADKKNKSVTIFSKDLD